MQDQQLSKQQVEEECVLQLRQQVSRLQQRVHEMQAQCTDVLRLQRLVQQLLDERRTNSFQTLPGKEERESAANAAAELAAQQCKLQQLQQLKAKLDEWNNSKPCVACGTRVRIGNTCVCVQISKLEAQLQGDAHGRHLLDAAGTPRPETEEEKKLKAEMGAREKALKMIPHGVKDETPQKSE